MMKENQKKKEEERKEEDKQRNTRSCNLMTIKNFEKLFKTLSQTNQHDNNNVWEEVLQPKDKQAVKQ